MKRFTLLLSLLFVLLLVGCTSADGLFQLVSPTGYTVESEHKSSTQAETPDTLTAENYDSLCDAITSLIAAHIREGKIQVPNTYEGTVAEDAKAAVYAVWKSDPLSAYSVEYITAECSQLLNYSEVAITVDYRKTEAELAALRSVRTTNEAAEELRNALDNQVTELAIQISYYRNNLDCQSIVDKYCAENPESIMEKPTVTVNSYPESGSVRILDITLTYTHTSEELKTMRNAVSGVLSSAANYVRYRSDPGTKADLIYRYLCERFDYETGQSLTPMYSFLCEGILDTETVATVYDILLDRVEIPCSLVTGYRNGEPYYWVILTINGVNYHADPMEDILQGSDSLHLHYDEEMTGFSWDTSAYPSCPMPVQVETGKQIIQEQPNPDEEESNSPEEP